MKFFILTLPLAILTGTWASVLRDEPVSELEKLRQQAREDAEKFKEALLSKAFVIEREEDLGPMEFLERAFMNFSRHLRNLDKELPDEVMDTFEVFVGVPKLVGEKAVTALFDLGRHGRHKLEELGKALQSAAAVYADPVLERVGPYAETVRSAVVTKAQEINQKIDEKLPEHVQTLRTQLDPHIKKLQELQAELRPYLDHGQELFRKGAETIHKHLLKPYVAPIVEFFQKHKSDLKEWSRAPVFYPNP